MLTASANPATTVGHGVRVRHVGMPRLKRGFWVVLHGELNLPGLVLAEKFCNHRQAEIYAGGYAVRPEARFRSMTQRSLTASAP